MNERLYNVLFLCTGNSARSLLAEAQLNELGQGRFKGFSAGSHPGGRVNPFTLELLSDMGLSTAGLRSKSWDEFTLPDAPRLDFVITVCDQAAGEQCPFWPGQPTTAHWGVPDPATVQGSDDVKRQAFKEAAISLRRRVELFIKLPLASIDRMTLKSRLNDIGSFP